MTAVPDPNQRRARELFADLLDLPADQRATFLARACGGNAHLQSEVESLLALHERAEQRLAEPHEVPGEQPGDQIGQYRLVARLGEGGFGTVWRAEQEKPVRRTVALKVLKPGLDTRQVVARFAAERQALALMDHPHIARVFDGGATALGRPYFVMELVDGVPITTWCDAARLPMTERLLLFVQVCEAVQHAHHKGVIHRDLKPGNVLVTTIDGRPAPKVIDFGIAKATAGSLTTRLVTLDRQVLGTPEYMAPEQAEPSSSDVDTRADVYSLGVLLYELLTGTRPFDFTALAKDGYAAIVQAIQEVEPPRPSTRVSTVVGDVLEVARRRSAHPRALQRLVRGDLDWIVMKALEKDRQRRYATAAALAEDVRRHLQHEPVLAGPPSTGYRLAKYVRRHRVGVTMATVVFAALAGGLTLFALGYQDARAAEARALSDRRDALAARADELRQRELAQDKEREARTEAARAKRVVDLLEQMLTSANPMEAHQRDYTLRQLLDAFDRKLGKQVSAEPEVEATLRAAMAGSYLGIGLYDKAEQHVQVAMGLVQQVRGDADPALAHCLLTEARIAYEQSRFVAAETACRRALAIWEAQGEAGADEAGDALRKLSDFLVARGRMADAVTSAERSLAIEARLHPGNHEDVAAAWGTIAHACHAAGKIERGLEAARLALDMDRSVRSADDPLLLGRLTVLSALLAEQGTWGEAEALAHEATALAIRSYGEEHRAVLDATNHLAGLRQRQGQLNECLRLRRKVLDLGHKLFGDEHAFLVSETHNIAMVLLEKGQFSQAEKSLRKALELGRKVYGARHTEVATCLNSLGQVCYRQGQFRSAETHYREALAMRSELLGDDSAITAMSRNDLGVLLLDRGDLTEAADQLRRAGESLRQAHGRDTIEILVNLGNQALVRLRQGDAAAAAQAYADLLPRMRAVFGDTHVQVATLLNGLANALEDQGRYAESEQRYHECLGVLDRLSPDAPHPFLPRTLGNLAVVQCRKGDNPAAETSLRRALELEARIYGAESPGSAPFLHSLATILHDRNDDAEAEAMAQRALALFRAQDQNHYHLPSVLDLLGSIRAAAKRFAEAEQCYQEALARRTGADGARHPQAGVTLSQLGTLALQRGDVAAAERWLREALELRRLRNGEAHPDYALALSGVSLAVAARGDFEQALSLRRQALAVPLPAGASRPSHIGLTATASDGALLAELAQTLENALGKGSTAAPVVALWRQTATAHEAAAEFAAAEPIWRDLVARARKDAANLPLLAESAAALGRVLLRLGRPAEAEPHLLEVLDKTTHPPLQRPILEQLAALCDAMQRPEQAAAWRKRLAEVPR